MLEETASTHLLVLNQKSNPRKTNSSGARALYGIGSRSRIKLETMFNVNNSNAIQTTDNNSDDSKCNVDEDEENVFGGSPNSKMEKSATFAALRPDTEKTQNDLLMVRRYLTELSD